MQGLRAAGWMRTLLVDDTTLLPLTQMMQKRDVLRVVGLRKEQDKYSPAAYMMWKHRDHAEIHVYVDRNVLSYIRQFYNRIETTRDLQRITLAHVFFFDLIGIQMFNFMEGMMEYGSSAGANPEIFQQEWDFLFSINRQPFNRMMDFILNGHYYNAKAFIKRFNKPKIEELGSPEVSWHSIYTNLLLIKIFENRCSDNTDRLLSYLDFVHQNYEFATVCIHFAFVMFSDNRHKDMLPNTLEGIRNVAWDLKLLSYWLQRSNAALEAKDRVDVLMSFDRNVLKFAGYLAEMIYVDLMSSSSSYAFYQSKSAATGKIFVDRMKWIFDNRDEPTRRRKNSGSVELREMFQGKFEEIVSTKDWTRPLDA